MSPSHLTRNALIVWRRYVRLVLFRTNVNLDLHLPARN